MWNINDFGGLLALSAATFFRQYTQRKSPNKFALISIFPELKNTILIKLRFFLMHRFAT